MRRNYLQQLAALLLAVMLFCSMLVMSGCSHKRDPDCMVSFILTGDYSEEFIEIIYKHLEAYGQDVSGDGEVKFQFAKYWPGDPTRLFSEFTYADSMIFITDCAPLENISENFEGFCMPLTEDGETALSWSELPGLKALDWSEHPINVQGLELTTEQLEEWSSGLKICIRSIEGTRFEKDKQKSAEHMCALAVLEALKKE